MGWVSFRRAWARGAPGEAKGGRNRRKTSSLLAQPGIQFVIQSFRDRFSSLGPLGSGVIPFPNGSCREDEPKTVLEARRGEVDKGTGNLEME
jgi:hypothetical protein